MTRIIIWRQESTKQTYIYHTKHIYELKMLKMLDGNINLEDISFFLTSILKTG